jgi:hypothetical protein
MKFNFASSMISAKFFFLLHETQKENCLPNRNWKKELSVDVADGGSNAIGGGTKRTSLVDVTWRWERERRVK